MPEGATGSARENAAWRIERWGLASLRFVGDFWLLFLMTLVLGALFVLVPQGQETWRHYILSPAPGLSQVGWELMHAAFVAGGFLFTGVVFARYALRRALFRQEQGRPPALWTVPGAALLPLILALAGIACAAADYLSAGVVGARMLVAVCMAAGFIVAGIAAVVALGLTAGAGGFADLVGRRSTSAVTAVVAVLLLIMFLGLPWLPEPVFVSSAQLVGALPALLLSLALVIYGVDAAFRATGPRKVLAVGLLVLVGVGILFGDMATAHRVRSVRKVEKDLPDVGSEFLRWLETRKDKDKKGYAEGHYPVFIVAAQGGGLYAAHHTARVLAVLQDECPAFAQHVFAISGVSGGSLGAAVFASAVKSLAPEQTLEPCRVPGSSTRFLEYTDRFLTRDFLSPAAFLSVVPNIAQRVLGLPWTVLGMVPEKLRKALRVGLREQRRGVTQYDRALGLEYGFEQAWRDAEGGSSKGTSGSNFFTTPSTAAWSGGDAVPALIFNAARADTGVTYAVAPFRLDNVKSLDFRAKVLGHEAPKVDVRISTGVGLSSRVPFITGPGMIRVVGRKWPTRDDNTFETIGLVDGAYVENSGTATLGELLREIHNAVVKNGNQKVKIIVVAIQDLSAFTYSHSGIETLSDAKEVALPDGLDDLIERKDFERPFRLGFAEFTAPLAALNASRTARSFYTLNSLVETVATLRCAQGIADDKKTDGRCAASKLSRSGEIIDVELVGSALFGFTANNRPLPLAWLLSSLSRERIEKRTWVATHQSWRCEKQNAIPIDGKEHQAMSDADIAELRGLGEDLGGFIDRWISACGRNHVRGHLGG